MSGKMTAKDLFIDFLNLVFLISLIIFSLFYFVLEDNFHLALKFLRSLIPLSFFGLMLAFRLKLNEKRRKKKEREGGLEMELWLSYMDKAKSEFFLYSLPITILFIPMAFTMTANILDILQALTVFVLAYLWQRILFIKRGSFDREGISIKLKYSDKIKGDVLTFSLPLIVLLLPSIFLIPLDVCDIAQATTVFLISVFWQFFLFSKEV